MMVLGGRQRPVAPGLRAAVDRLPRCGGEARPMDSRAAAVFLITVGLVGLVDLACLALLPDVDQPDTASYIAPGKRLVAGLGFTNAAGDPELIRTPLYPA